MPRWFSDASSSIGRTPLVPGFNWSVAEIVSQLRELREASPDVQRPASRPLKMPSRQTLVDVVEGLTVALFPNRVGRGDLAGEGIDYFVGHTLDVTLHHLYEQLLRELQFAAGEQSRAEDCQEQAAEMTRRFAARLPAIRSCLESDIRAAYEGDPAARSVDEVLICYPGIAAVTHHRLAHALYELGAPLVARLIAEIAHSATGIDIHPGASIQGSFFIDHGTGVVIGETCVIGQRVRLYQAVTLGARRFPVDEHGALIKGNERHPIVEDDVVIYAGATILGRITIGRGSSIGGNVWLTRSVPPGSNVTQAKVRNEVFDGGGGI